MNNLQIINQNGQLLVDSRNVAEIIGRPHNDLIKSIRTYSEYLTKGDFPLSDFFIIHTYKDGTGRELPCFLLTRKGCDMVANKLTGEKGTLFTAAYVTKFEEMENNKAVDLTGLSPQLQILIQQEQEIKHLKDRQDNTEQQISTIKETFLQRDDNWRQKINGLFNGVAKRSGQAYRDVRSESYQMLEERAKCDLNRRLANLRERLADSGATKTKINDTNRMDVIEADPRLKEIYTTIVKELSIGTLV